MKKNIIGIIGGGNMGEALIKGVIEKKLSSPKNVFVCETDSARAQYLKKNYHVTITDLKDAIDKANIILFAVKPQDMENVLQQVGSCSGKLFISIAAGLTTKFFEDHLGGKPKVIRAMPNMPALICQGTTGICVGTYANLADLKIAQGVLAGTGGTIVVKENMMDAVTAVSGSGPAYVFLFVEQWIAAAISLGLSEEQAKHLVLETLLGSVHLLQQGQLDAAQLRAKVTSKGGTTQAAMDVFLKGKFDQLMKDALLAAKKRAKELAK